MQRIIVVLDGMSVTARSGVSNLKKDIKRCRDYNFFIQELITSQFTTLISLLISMYDCASIPLHQHTSDLGPL